MTALWLWLAVAGAQDITVGGGLSASRSVWHVSTDSSFTVPTTDRSTGEPIVANLDFSTQKYPTWVTGIDLSVGLFDRFDVGGVIQLDPESKAIQQALGAIGLDRTRITIEVAQLRGSATATLDNPNADVAFISGSDATATSTSDGITHSNPMTTRYRWINVSETFGGEPGVRYPPVRLGVAWITWTQPVLGSSGGVLSLNAASRVDVVGFSYGIHILDRLMVDEVQPGWVREVGDWRFGLGDIDVILGFGFRSETGDAIVRRTGAPGLGVIQKLGPAFSAPVGNGRVGGQLGGDMRIWVGPGTGEKPSSLLLLGLFGAASARF